MALFRHKGGALNIPGTDVTLYYGPGLHKSCPTCKVTKNVRCVTPQGNLLKKTHTARLTD